MAIYRAGPLAGALSGPVGGVVFVESKGSKVVRHRPATLNKIQRRRASDTSEPHAALQTAITGWLALDDIHRIAWKAQAANVTFPNRLGQQRNISGYQLYLRVNILRAYGDIAVMNAAPGVTRPGVVTSATVIASVINGLDITVNPTGAGGGVAAILYGSVRWSGTVTAYFRDFRWLTRPLFAAGVSQELIAQWTPIFGPLRLGQHIAIRIVPWTILTYPSSPFTIATTVVA